ncbi:MAG TPA: cytochrome c oxidase subunit 3 family protein [Candidatus Dormibacteraeota bacterium]|nr:cytochrome c oxidase subunit 3 family protein [Candidatus Dormibacteraeota bacterium]
MLEQTAPYVAHHFDDAEQQHDASTLGMWVFLAQEVMFFGGLFTTYVVYRTAFPEAFHAGSHELDITLGAFNTVVLLTSSLTMALSVHAAQVSRRGMLIVNLILTLILGSVFLGVKVIEYAAKFEHHLVPGPHFQFHGADATNAQLFFSLYFAMTGLHALHMIVGAGLLLVLIARSWQGMFNRNYYTPVEMVGLYWHFVDLIWIFLFPLLYLLGRH